MASTDYFALTRTLFAPFDVSDVVDATSKVTTRQLGRGQNTNRMNLARAVAHQSGIMTVCKRADGAEPVLRGAVSRVAEKTEHTGPLESQYRRVDLEQTADWRRRVRWKSVEFGDLTDAQLAQRIITMRLEQAQRRNRGSLHTSGTFTCRACAWKASWCASTPATLRIRPTMRGASVQGLLLAAPD